MVGFNIDSGLSNVENDKLEKFSTLFTLKILINKVF